MLIQTSPSAWPAADRSSSDYPRKMARLPIKGQKGCGWMARHDQARCGQSNLRRFLTALQG
jgi:hypothetical protein